MTGGAPPAFSIVIPTWNGLDLLRRFLPSIVAEAERAQAELVVSDDGSDDGTAAWLAASAPRALVVRSEINRGFSPAVNAGVARARAEIVVLLNNDLELPAGSLTTVAEHFHDPNLFGVTFRGLDLPGGSLATGGKLGRFRRGFWETWRNYDAAPAPGLESFMLVGGFCALRRSRFLELSGFDPMFAPYYSEDLDLSYRARKRGWRIGYDPRIEVLHLREASTARHRPAFQRAVVTERNRLLFHWRNLDSAGLARHLVWAHLVLAQKLLTGRMAYPAGYLRALAHAPAIWAFRRRERAAWRRRDGELELTSSF